MREHIVFWTVSHIREQISVKGGYPSRTGGLENVSWVGAFAFSAYVSETLNPRGVMRRILAAINAENPRQIRGNLEQAISEPTIR